MSVAQHYTSCTTLYKQQARVTLLFLIEKLSSRAYMLITWYIYFAWPESTLGTKLHEPVSDPAAHLDDLAPGLYSGFSNFP